jgi:hypothetical protein
MAVRSRLVPEADVFGAKALVATPVIPCGIVTVPLQATPAAEGIVCVETWKLPPAEQETKYDVLTAELVE